MIYEMRSITIRLCLLSGSSVFVSMLFSAAPLIKRRGEGTPFRELIRNLNEASQKRDRAAMERIYAGRFHVCSFNGLGR